ncbi:MAG: aromatic amino acid transport family protein [Patescibacteria group bacterium]
MSKISNSLKSIGLVVSATVGAGIFALPYVFYRVGWATSFFYLIGLSFLVASAHFIYWRVLKKLETKERLLGLVRRYLGRGSFELAFFAIIGGLILSLVAYLILGSHFLSLVFPSLGMWTGVIIFWVLSSLPLFLNPRRFVTAELLGGVAVIGLVAFIFSSAWPIDGALSLKAFDYKNLILPFGVILFALAGWTAVEPIFESEKKSGGENRGRFRDFSVGALGSALLYLMFVLAIFASAEKIAPDTISGLGNWERWKLALLGIFGLFALWTSYLPIATEVKNLVEKDLKWKKSWGEALVIGAPIFLVAAGLNNFLSVVGLVGGVFLALQYLFIVMVGQKVLKFGFWGTVLAVGLDVVFASAAVYQVVETRLW